LLGTRRALSNSLYIIGLVQYNAIGLLS